MTVGILRYLHTFICLICFFITGGKASNSSAEPNTGIVCQIDVIILFVVL